MTDQNQFFMFLGIGIGAIAGTSIIVLVAFIVEVLGSFYHAWHLARELAQSVTEKAHKRWVELLAKMIESNRQGRRFRQNNVLSHFSQNEAKQRSET